MTKTLYKRIETELNSNLYLSHDFNEIEKEFLRLTKEWLQEKRSELQGTDRARHKFLDELLAEVDS